MRCLKMNKRQGLLRVKSRAGYYWKGWHMYARSMKKYRGANTDLVPGPGGTGLFILNDKIT